MYYLIEVELDNLLHLKTFVLTLLQKDKNWLRSSMDRIEVS